MELETNNQVDKVQSVAEELALQSVISEERHDEIVEESNRIWKRLEALSVEMSNRDQQTNQALVSEMKALKTVLTEMRAELESLKSSTGTRSQTLETLNQPNPPNPEDGPEVVRTEPTAPMPVTVVEVQPPAPAPALPKKRHRI